ncbi:hypothetical protein H8959_013101, partial [Pygathrix nigripes]
MEDDAPVIYGLEFQARALTPQTAETDAIRFLVGTQSLKYDNQIHIIDFDDENNIINKNVLLHQAGEIWHISASPADRGVLATCYNRSKCGFSKCKKRKQSRWGMSPGLCVRDLEHAGAVSFPGVVVLAGAVLSAGDIIESFGILPLAQSPTIVFVNTLHQVFFRGQVVEVWCAVLFCGLLVCALPLAHSRFDAAAIPLG